MNIGICGGTFDPFHRGHLDPILAIRESMQWDRVLFVPAFVQPFKQERETASAPHRFAMAVLATEGDDDLYVDPRELERGAVSYTIDTLRELRAEYPEAMLDWIIGDDNLEKLHEWKEIDAIFTLARIVVLTRSPVLHPRASILESHSVVYAENALVPVSSTEIRRRAHAGEPIEDLVGVRVSRYIHHYGLYRKGQS